MKQSLDSKQYNTHMNQNACPITNIQIMKSAQDSTFQVKAKSKQFEIPVTDYQVEISKCTKFI